MFGFGKNKEKEQREQRAFAGIALQAIHETQKEFLENLDKFLVEEMEVTYEHYGTSSFYSSKMPIAEDVVAYSLGFIFGVCQSYGRNEIFAGAAVAYFGEAYEKTTTNYLNVLNMKTYEKSFFDEFEDVWTSKKYLQDEYTGNVFIQGLAEGKDYADISREVEENYSVLKSPDTAEKFNLTGLRNILKSWQTSLLLSNELMVLAKMPLDWSDEQIDAELIRQGYDPKDFK